MKKNLLLTLLLVVVGCSDKWHLEQSYKSLSGSVASIYEYVVEGMLDGEELPMDPDAGICFLTIGGSAPDRIDLSFRFAPALDSYERILYIDTSPFVLSGKPAYVRFNDNIKLSIINDNNQVFQEEASINGWINNKTLIELWTKASPIDFEYDGEIVITWGAPQTHILTIDRIIRYPSFNNTRQE